jgi:predicted nucleotidyltransferase
VTILADRLASTQKTLQRLGEQVKGAMGEHFHRIFRGDTCIYVVGSGGRGEMSEHSDVDLFVARVERDPSDVDAFQVRSAIAQALYSMSLPDPSQGGEYLKMHTAGTLCARMGTPEDDASNTLTARMLLLLESRPLLGDDAYSRLLDKVLDAYWKDAKGHDADFQPFVLVNDIVRYWRILLLNYVAKLAEKERELDESRRDADRRVRSFKLRFSRCMTCFSALAGLLAATQEGAVSKTRVLEIVKHRPVERLQAVASAGGAVGGHVDALLFLYERFLLHSGAEKNALIERFTDTSFKNERMREGQEFGNRMFDLLQELGRDGRGKELLRHMLV